MNSLPEQFTEFNQVALSSSYRFAKLYMDSTERLLTLGLETAKSSLEDSARTVKALGQIKDVQELTSARAKIAETSVDKMLSYSRGIYDLASETQAEFAQAIEENLAVFNQNLTSMIDKAAKSAPAGADVAVAAMKSTVAATSAAVDSFTKAAKQVANLTDANVKAAGTATAAAVKSASASKRAA